MTDERADSGGDRTVALGPRGCAALVLLVLLVFYAVAGTSRPSQRWGPRAALPPSPNAPAVISGVDGRPGPALPAAPGTPAPTRAPLQPGPMSTGCDFDTAADLLRFQDGDWRWQPPAAAWCGLPPLPLPGQELHRRLRGKRVLFLGDSIARNSFVVTMARLCNERNMRRCMQRMPTFEFDRDIADPAVRGPVGCIPANDTAFEAAVKGGARPADMRTPCERDGDFRFVPLSGLTTKTIAPSRKDRRAFIKQGKIAPAFHAQWGNVTLTYLGVNKPWQVGKVAGWMARHPGSYLAADAVVVSVGPHMRHPEVEAAPTTLPPALRVLRAALPRVPVAVAEFVPVARLPANMSAFVGGVMRQLRARLVPLGIPLVPQRYVTKGGFTTHAGSDAVTRMALTEAASCPYYDQQHPGLRCQELLTELILATVLVQLERGMPPLR